MVAPMSMITITTDFATQDGYVGALKGVIASIAPGAACVDITHEVPPYDIRAAAYVVSQVAHHYPPNTVHLVVVDPGVGGARRALAATDGAQLYVGPDNGVFDLVCARFTEVREIDPAWAAPDGKIAPTFHGRDLFAPCAARLATGKTLASVGPPTTARPHQLLPVERSKSEVRGTVVHVDRFGNLITNISAQDVGTRVSGVHAGKFLVRSMRTTFEDVAKGRPLAYVGSGGMLELAVRQGSAAKRYRIRRGSRVTVRR